MRASGDRRTALENQTDKSNDPRHRFERHQRSGNDRRRIGRQIEVAAIRQKQRLPHWHRGGIFIEGRALLGPEAAVQHRRHAHEQHQRKGNDQTDPEPGPVKQPAQADQTLVSVSRVRLASAPMRKVRTAVAARPSASKASPTGDPPVCSADRPVPANRPSAT